MVTPRPVTGSFSELQLPSVLAWSVRISSHSVLLLGILSNDYLLSMKLSKLIIMIVFF